MNYGDGNEYGADGVVYKGQKRIWRLGGNQLRKYLDAFLVRADPGPCHGDGLLVTRMGYRALVPVVRYQSENHLAR